VRNLSQSHFFARCDSKVYGNRSRCETGTPVVHPIQLALETKGTTAFRLMANFPGAIREKTPTNPGQLHFVQAK
jgi:hypothetical protein